RPSAIGLPSCPRSADPCRPRHALPALAQSKLQDPPPTTPTNSTCFYLVCPFSAILPAVIIAFRRRAPTTRTRKHTNPDARLLLPVSNRMPVQRTASLRCHPELSRAGCG